ncbi:MAG: S1-like domain-containing RNA-binding protein [Firmicutes bacterium]|nr:S1-like domain-containing RNA-binding protein [Bacillota bacterium]MCM1401714.1 S1-like domain-containing RNA-binding protein [Bacteroides sp.]MCM1477743.1 S1-like domain-containing RNA-binding protein [Bacteroides sp.]
MKIGNYNTLKVARHADFGVYLADESGNEVLLPARYITDPLADGEEIRVFVYNDSEDRPVATTETPKATVGEFAYLTVKSVNNVGAFLDWGLLKDLLVPFSQQKERMVQGRTYLVYVYLDHSSKRIVATAKINQYLGNMYPDYKRGDRVEALVCKRTPIGYSCIVNNNHKGMLYASELFRPVEPGNRLTAYVKSVREDGKIDLTLNDSSQARTATLASKISRYMESRGGSLDLGDHSSPDVIKFRFQCSKKDFKKAIGLLLKEHKIKKESDGYALLTD